MRLRKSFINMLEGGANIRQRLFHFGIKWLARFAPRELDAFYGHQAALKNLWYYFPLSYEVEPSDYFLSIAILRS